MRIVPPGGLGLTDYMNMSLRVQKVMVDLLTSVSFFLRKLIMQHYVLIVPFTWVSV